MKGNEDYVYDAKNADDRFNEGRYIDGVWTSYDELAFGAGDGELTDLRMRTAKAEPPRCRKCTETVNACSCNQCGCRVCVSNDCVCHHLLGPDDTVEIEDGAPQAYVHPGVSAPVENDLEDLIVRSSVVNLAQLYRAGVKSGVITAGQAYA